MCWKRDGEGLIEVLSWTGSAERAVLLPHVTYLWIDHIDSALRRANAIVPGLRRRLHDETMDPVVEVGPPVRAWGPERALAAEVLFSVDAIHEHTQGVCADG